MSDKKRLERYIDYVRYALYSLYMSSAILLLLLWRYYKLLANGVALAIGIGICVTSYFGNWALNRISKQIPHGIESDMNQTKVSIEGTI